MSETAPETTPAATETPDPAVTETPDATSDLGDNGKKALDAERRARKAADKALTEMAAKLQAFEDANKSETEKAATRAEAAEKRALEAEAKVMRADVADELKVPMELRKFLTATDEEGLRAQAEEVLSAFTAATAASRTTPRPDPTQGAKPAALGDTLDDRIAAATKAGDIPALIALKRAKAYAPTT